MANVKEQIEQHFICPKCRSRGAVVEYLSMSGTGLSRLFEVQPYRYAFVSCKNCGFTEVYNLDILEGADNLGSLLDVLFSG